MSQQLLGRETRALDLSHHWASGAARVYILVWLNSAVVVGLGACSSWKILKSTCTCSEITSGGFWDCLYHSRHAAKALSVFIATQNVSCCKTDRLKHQSFLKANVEAVTSHTASPSHICFSWTQGQQTSICTQQPLGYATAGSKVLSINFSIGTAGSKWGGCLKSSDHWFNTWWNWSVKWFLLHAL